MARVYISYSWSDEDRFKLATIVADGLKERGHTILIDRDLMDASTPFRDVLTQAMEKCDVVVALIAERSVNSQFVMAEIGAARALKKALIPVLVGLPDIPEVINDLHVFRADPADMASAIERIDAKLKRLDQAHPPVENKNVFIVHGQNEAKKLELKNFLTTLGLRPIILHEQVNKGLTIIEKFEHYAPQSTFAFVLMTPDDETPVQNATEAKWRARQNVIMELGWFMAKLGRARVIILYQGELEIPSDILGIVYLKFQTSVVEVSEAIREELRNANLIN